MSSSPTKRGFLHSGTPRCAFVGCLHLLPLPGSPRWGGSFSAVVDRVVREAEVYLAEGADGLLLENTHDLPYLRAEAEAATVAGMAVVAAAVRHRHPDVPIGIQMLAAADLAALDVAITCDLDFVRAEGFIYAHVADEGVIQGEAARLLRRRAHLKADHIEIFADVKKKHGAHALTSDLTLREFARGAVFCGADGVIVTGPVTGHPPDPERLREVADLGVRIAVGSGVSAENISDFAELADILIVGSACKRDGDWRNELEPPRIRSLIERLHK